MDYKLNLRMIRASHPRPIVRNEKNKIKSRDTITKYEEV
jgi:hypothetical protein